MSLLLNMGNVGGGGSFAESVLGMKLAASQSLYVWWTGNYYVHAGDAFSCNGSGIASVKMYGSFSTVAGYFHIKIDDVTVDDYEHFMDYRRGYAYGYGYPAFYFRDVNSSVYQNSVKDVNECHFNYLTIPFSEKLEIGFPSSFSISNSRYGNGRSRESGIRTASIAVWKNEE